jgi:hypothetical protein
MARQWQTESPNTQARSFRRGQPPSSFPRMRESSVVMPGSHAQSGQIFSSFPRMRESSVVMPGSHVQSGQIFSSFPRMRESSVVGY